MGREYTRQVAVIGEIPVGNRIIIADDFEGLNKWFQQGASGDSIFELDPSVAKFGNQSLYIKSRTASSAEDDIAGAELSTHLLPTKVFRVNVSFMIPTIANCKYFNIYLNWYDMISLHTCGIRYAHDTPEWLYGDAPASYVAIPNSGLELVAGAWNNLLLDINFAASRYISLQVNHFSLDLSSYMAYKTANPAASRLQIILRCYANATGPIDLNLDNVFLYEI